MCNFITFPWASLWACESPTYSPESMCQNGILVHGKNVPNKDTEDLLSDICVKETRTRNFFCYITSSFSFIKFAKRKDYKLKPGVSQGAMFRICILLQVFYHALTACHNHPRVHSHFAKGLPLPYSY